MNRVLLIEDALDVRELLKIYLVDIGYQVIEAGSGKEGLQVFLDQDPDLVITDIILPEMSGFDVIKSIRRENQNTPIIVLSGYLEELNATERLGVFATMQKPPTYQELEEILSDCFSKKSKIVDG